ncbi:MAG: DUF4265 domain-containing protein [Candidatus Gracilibacteria bacterium]
MQNLNKHNQVKVFIEYGNDGQYESCWAFDLGKGNLVIDNVPLFAYGISAEDVVLATKREGNWFYEKVIKKGGHSTYRIFLNENKTESDFMKYWEGFKKLGCSFEGFNNRLIAIDIPPGVDINNAENELHKGYKDKIWIYERANIEHKNSKE